MFTCTLTIVAIVSAVIASGIPKRTIDQCSGYPAGVYFNDTSLTDTPTKAVDLPGSNPVILTGSFAYNGHGGAPCAPLFALGITKSETAPSNVLSSEWVDRIAIGGYQSNALVLDAHIASGIYNVFLVQYDPANGEVIANPYSQSKGKICYRAIYPLTGNPCD